MEYSTEAISRYLNTNHRVCRAQISGWRYATVLEVSTQLLSRLPRPRQMTGNTGYLTGGIASREVHLVTSGS